MKISSLYEKEIISIIDGNKLGEIYDIEINEHSGKIESLILCGKWNVFRFFKKKEEYCISWNCVRVIGEETVLVEDKISNI